jgi:MATE family multidrug resistance protein
MSPLSFFRHRWSAPNGYADVLRISLPLVFSMGSTTLILYTDRAFLGNYSLNALTAATPAGLAAFTFIALFLGIATYCNTFVAQYIGAKQPHMVGRALWTGIHFSLLAGIFLAGISTLAKRIFTAGGHPPEVQTLEVIYFQIITFGGVITLLRDSLSCFYSGRGLTRVILAVNAIAAGVNIPLNYVMINGLLGFPEWGIRGAAYATVLSNMLAMLIFAALIFGRKQNASFGVRSEYRFSADLFRRLLRYGGPAGLQFFIDILAFTLFVFLVGRLGETALAATNIALANNLLAFLPMIGFSIAVSTLVGQSIGRGKPEDGEYATISAVHLTSIYMCIIAILFVLVPGVLVDIFRPAVYSTEEFSAIRITSIHLMRFVAAFSIFDAMNLVFSAALKGAGDTRYVGWTVAFASTFLLVLPVYLVLNFFDGNIYAAWIIATLYVGIVALLFLRRFNQGRWKTMSVIEPAAQAQRPSS